MPVTPEFDDEWSQELSTNGFKTRDAMNKEKVLKYLDLPPPLDLGSYLSVGDAALPTSRRSSKSEHDPASGTTAEPEHHLAEQQPHKEEAEAEEKQRKHKEKKHKEKHREDKPTEEKDKEKKKERRKSLKVAHGSCDLGSGSGSDDGESHHLVPEKKHKEKKDEKEKEKGEKDEKDEKERRKTRRASTSIDLLKDKPAPKIKSRKQSMVDLRQEVDSEPPAPKPKRSNSRHNLVGSIPKVMVYLENGEGADSSTTEPAHSTRKSSSKNKAKAQPAFELAIDPETGEPKLVMT